jgi:hypothetical protein
MKLCYLQENEWSWLEIILLSEISYTEKGNYLMFSHICRIYVFKKKKAHVCNPSYSETKTRRMAVRGQHKQIYAFQQMNWT